MCRHQARLIYPGEDQGQKNRMSRVSWDGYVNATAHEPYSDEELHEVLFGDSTFGGST